MFSARTQFSDCQFLSRTSFRAAQFKGDLDIAGTFSKGADFSHAHFDGDVRLKIKADGSVQLNNIACANSFWLSSAIGIAETLEMKDACVTGPVKIGGIYHQAVDLSGSRFLSKFAFAADVRKTFNGSQCVFAAEADFRGSKFMNAVTLVEATFSGRVRFYSLFMGPIKLLDCRFDDEADFSLSRDVDAAIGPISFRGTAFNGMALFTNRKFTSTTNFELCKFAFAPEFHGASLHQDTRFPRIDAFADTHTDASAAAYRTLRQAMEVNNARREEAMFYALEQRTLRNIPGAQTRWENLASTLYDALSGYGVNFWRPIAWLMLVAAFMGCVYSIWITWPIDFASRLDLKLLSQGMAFSIEQIVNPFWVWRDSEPAWNAAWPNLLKVVATVQSLVTTGLFALSLLALRWRFKRD